MHIDMSKALESYGYKITFIYSGDHKVDGNPYEALSAEVKADIQKSVDKSRAKFVAVVARNLGLDSKIIYDTQARTYRADDALALGLITKIAVPSAALQTAIDGDDEEQDQPDPAPTGDEGDEQAAKTETTTNEEMTMDPTQGNNTPAAGQPAAAVNQDAAKAERARVQGILACAEAEGRGELANHFAFNTSMSVDDAKAAMAVAPKAAAAAAAPAATTNTLHQAMANTAQPNVGADAAAGAAGAAAGEKPTAEQMADAVLRDFGRATGYALDEK
jgi:ClpP class serine protease